MPTKVWPLVVKFVKYCWNLLQCLSGTKDIYIKNSYTIHNVTDYEKYKTRLAVLWSFGHNLRAFSWNCHFKEAVQRDFQPPVFFIIGFFLCHWPTGSYISDIGKDFCVIRFLSSTKTDSRGGRDRHARGIRPREVTYFRSDSQAWSQIFSTRWTVPLTFCEIFLYLLPGVDQASGPGPVHHIPLIEMIKLIILPEFSVDIFHTCVFFGDIWFLSHYDVKNVSFLLLVYLLFNSGALFLKQLFFISSRGFNAQVDIQ